MLRGAVATLRIICRVLMLAGLLAIPSATRAARKPPPPTAPEGPQFFLSGHQPWGTPGASRERHPTCRDTTTADTLFLSFKPSVSGAAP